MACDIRLLGAQENSPYRANFKPPLEVVAGDLITASRNKELTASRERCLINFSLDICVSGVYNISVERITNEAQRLGKAP